MNKKDRLKVIDALGQLLKGNIPETSEGICSNVGKITGIHCCYYNEHFITWKHYSGSFAFPVPKTRGWRDEQSIYFSSHNVWINKYGELRKDLCRHIIRELKKEEKRRTKK